MAKVNGTLWTILDGSDTILHSTSCTMTVEQDLPDCTNKGSGGWEEHINGVRRATFDFDGMYDTSGSGKTANEIIADIVARTADATFKFSPDSGTSGWTGTGTYQTATLSADAENPTTFSGSLKLNGALAAI